ncbi:hypothetical protein PV440_38390, partial [Streptomyces sp. ME02-6985-2c]|nr:hypothetical protein [Streptomyces sp. ME02-6985-2c]
ARGDGRVPHPLAPPPPPPRRHRRAPARRPAAPDDTEPGRPAVAAAWAAGTRRGRDGEQPSPAPAGTATHTAARTTPHDAADDEGH